MRFDLAELEVSPGLTLERATELVELVRADLQSQPQTDYSEGQSAALEFAESQCMLSLGRVLNCERNLRQTERKILRNGDPSGSRAAYVETLERALVRLRSVVGLLVDARYKVVRKRNGRS